MCGGRRARTDTVLAVRAEQASVDPRLADRYDLVLLTDGEASYTTLFPELFWQPYQPSRRSNRGRPLKIRFRILRRLTHV